MSTQKMKLCKAREDVACNEGYESRSVILLDRVGYI